MSGPLSGAGVRDKILSQGKETTEADAYYWRNLTQTVQDSSKGAISINSGRRAATCGFKTSKDFARGDALCGGLCCVSIGCKIISGD